MAKIAADPLIPVMYRLALAFPRSPIGEPATYGPFSDAAAEDFKWDAHITAYSCPMIERRLGTSAAFAYAPKMVLAIFDVDGPDHKFTDEWWSGEEPKIRALWRDRGAGYAYTTFGGYRIVYGIREPFELRSPADALRWRISYEDWLADLKANFGIDADPKCSDWTRLFRLPRVRRCRSTDQRHKDEDKCNGTCKDSVETASSLIEIGYADSMTPWRQPYADADDPRCLRAESQPVEAREAAPVDDAQIEIAAAALASRWPARGRHYASLSLTGALARAGWNEDAIADFVSLVCGLATATGAPPPGQDEAAWFRGHGEYEKRLAQARSSVEKIAAGSDDVSGWPALEGHLAAPETADAADVAEAVLAARRALGQGPAIDLFSKRLRERGSANEVKVRLGLAQPAPAPDDLLRQLAIPPDPLKMALIAACAEAGGGPEFLALLDLAAEKIVPIIAAEESKITQPNRSPMGMSAREMLARDLPPPEMLIAGLVPKQGLGALSGEPKSGKSWDLTYLGMCVASGVPAYRSTTNPGYPVTNTAAVLSIYLEDHESSINNRVKAIAAGLELDKHDPEGYWTDNWYGQPRGRALDVLRTEDLCVIVASAWRIHKLTGRRIGLVTIDPLSNAHSGEEDKRDSMKIVMARLHAVEVVLECAFGFVHHSAKSAVDPKKGHKRGGQAMRGSSVMHGAIDWGFYLSELDGDKKIEFIARIESEMKAARGAGVFRRTLRIEDNEHGNAVCATFEAGDYVEKAAEKTGESNDDAVEHCALTIVSKLFEQGGPLLFEKLREKVKRSKPLFSEALKFAEARAWVEKNYVGRQEAGLKLTEAGRALYQGVTTRTEPVAETRSNHPIAGFITVEPDQN